MATAVAKMAHYAQGGKVGGKGAGDKVRALLDPREVVLPPDTVKAVGLSTLKALIAATHKPTGKPQRGRIRRMADGGLVGDDPTKQRDPALSYGQQMANVGGAIASGVGRVAKEVFSTPADASSPSGYGLNRLVSGAPAAAAPAVAAPAPSAIATLAYNPAKDSQAANVAAPAAPAAPAVPTGTAVPDAPGVSKFVQNGRMLYTNVPGDNTMPSGTVSAQNNDAAQALSDRYGAAARLAATAPTAAPAAPPQSYIPGVNAPLSQYEQDTAARNAGVRSVFSQGGSRQDIAREQMANASAIAAMGNATSRANTRESVAGNIAGHEIGAGASRYSADTSAMTAAQRLALEAPGMQAHAQLTTQQVAAGQRLQDLQKKYLAATDPVERRQLYEALIASQGHVRSLAEKYTVVPQGSQVDLATGVVTHNPSKLFDNQLGKEVTLSEPTSGAGSTAKAPQYETGKVYQDAKGNKAKWDGQKFVAP